MNEQNRRAFVKAGMGGMIIWGHGLHIAWAMTSGRIAGRNAARAADRSKCTAGPGNGDLVDAHSAEVDKDRI